MTDATTTTRTAPGGLLRWASKRALLLIFVGLVAVLAIVSPGFRAPANLVNIVEQQSIIGIVACGMLMMILLGGFGLYELRKADHEVESMLEQSVVAQRLANRIRTRIADNRMQVALALQHDPASPVAKLHDHPLSMHLDTIAENKKAIDDAIAQLQRMDMPQDHRRELAKVVEARDKFVQEGLLPAVEAVGKSQFIAAAVQLIQAIKIGRASCRERV